MDPLYAIYCQQRADDVIFGWSTHIGESTCRSQ